MVMPLMLRRSGGKVPTDAQWANVTLLLHMNGANGATTFQDSSASAKAVTANGNAQLSTATPKFGTSCGLFDGSGDYLTVGDHADFDLGSGDFTIEGWARRTALPSVAYGLLTKRVATSNYAPFNLEITASAQLRAQVSTTGSSWVSITSSTTLTLNSYDHWAFVRNGGTLYLFINGQSVGSAAVSGALMTNTAAVVIGGASSTAEYGWTGSLDEVRITKGVARYTGNFTPPTEAFPNH